MTHCPECKSSLFVVRSVPSDQGYIGIVCCGNCGCAVGAIDLELKDMIRFQNAALDKIAKTLNIRL